MNAPINNSAQCLAEMIDTQLAHPLDSRTPIRDRRVLAAFGKVDRALFVPPGYRDQAYDDSPLPIGHGQTISQPYMQALQLEELRLKGHERVLEVGTGSGYQTALLAHLAHEVYSIERLPELLVEAERVLKSAGITRVHLRTGDGTLGWPEAAPFDAIVVCAGAPSLPRPLLEQLVIGGRMSVPVETPTYDGAQTLQLVTRRTDQLEQIEIRPSIACRYVRLIGQNGWSR